ncbi:MAG: hypothetical protein WBC50_04675 [Dehalococcoidales bacterium]
MFKTKRNIVLALAVCALLLPTTLIAKKLVERPLKIAGNITMVLDLATMTWEMEDWGEATHMGRYANYGSGYVTDPSLANGGGSGVNTAANGDQAFWDMVAEDGVWTVTFTGGTGRFENLTGDCILVPGEIVVDIGPTQFTYTYSYTGTGTITY